MNLRHGDIIGLQALNRQEKLQSAYDSGMELLRCILKHRAKVEEMVKAHPAMLERAYNKSNTAEERGRASFQEDEFPTQAVIAQLEREQSLTLAKLHILKHGHDKGVATVCPNSIKCMDSSNLT